jgi:hypothetical protein
MSEVAIEGTPSVVIHDATLESVDLPSPAFPAYHGTMLFYSVAACVVREAVGKRE